MLKEDLFGNSTASNGKAKPTSILNYGNNENKTSKCSTTPLSYAYNKNSSRVIKKICSTLNLLFFPQNMHFLPSSSIVIFEAQGSDYFTVLNLETLYMTKCIKYKVQ